MRRPGLAGAQPGTGTRPEFDRVPPPGCRGRGGYLHLGLRARIVGPQDAEIVAAVSVPQRKLEIRDEQVGRTMPARQYFEQENGARLRPWTIAEHRVERGCRDLAVLVPLPRTIDEGDAGRDQQGRRDRPARDRAPREQRVKEERNGQRQKCCRRVGEPVGIGHIRSHRHVRDQGSSGHAGQHANGRPRQEPAATSDHDEQRRRSGTACHVHARLEGIPAEETKHKDGIIDEDPPWCLGPVRARQERDVAPGTDQCPPRGEKADSDRQRCEHNGARIGGSFRLASGPRHGQQGQHQRRGDRKLVRQDRAAPSRTTVAPHLTHLLTPTGRSAHKR